MKVSASNYQPNAYPTVQNGVQSKSDSAVFTVDNSGTATNDASKDIWAELGSKYDIRHATFDELCEIATTLYKKGAISGGDCAIMTFDWKRAADDLRKDHPDVLADLNLTPADSEGLRDWIAEFDARAKRDFRCGNNWGYIQDQKLADILRRLSREKS